VPGQRKPRLIKISPRTGLRIAGVFGCLVVGALAYAAVMMIVQGRTTVRAQWRVAVTVGAGAFIALIVLIAACVAVAWWRHGMPPVLRRVLKVLTYALVLVSAVALRVVGMSGPPTAWQVGLAAFFVPVGCVALVLIPVLTWRRRTRGGGTAPDVRRLVAVTITARTDSWAVRWSGMGQTLAKLRAPTLISAVDQTLAAGANLRARGVTELRITIYPGPYHGGPTFDIAGEPGDLTATSARHQGQTLSGGTIEDLITAIGQTLPRSRKGFCLRWARVITAPAASPLPEHQDLDSRTATVTATPPHTGPI
jgi:hypothetical protein